LGSSAGPEHVWFGLKVNNDGVAKSRSTASRRVREMLNVPYACLRFGDATTPLHIESVNNGSLQSDCLVIVLPCRPDKESWRPGKKSLLILKPGGILHYFPA
jgi:hypothetical protein